MKSERIFLGTAVFSVALHLCVLFYGMPNLRLTLGEKGVERLAVSFGSMELPAFLTPRPATKKERYEETPPARSDDMPCDTGLVKEVEELQPVSEASYNQNPGDPTPAAGRIEDIRTRFLREVIARVQKAKRYPRSARNSGIEGTAKVEFGLSGEGRPASVEVITSSGHAVLDSEAIRIIERAAPFPPIPEELKISRMTLSFPIVFEINKKRGERSEDGKN